MTNESKTEADRKLWEAWLTKYVDVLKKQEESVAPSDLEAFAQNRVKVMNETNPRSVNSEEVLMEKKKMINKSVEK